MRPDFDALPIYLEEREGWAFGYSLTPETHDCARWSGAGVNVVHGVNPLDRFASQWTTRRGARRVLARHGGMAAAVNTVMRSIDPVAARRGDVGMTAEGQLVLFEGEGVVGLAEGRGYRRLPREAAVAAWTV